METFERDRESGGVTLQAGNFIRRLRRWISFWASNIYYLARKYFSSFLFFDSFFVSIHDFYHLDNRSVQHLIPIFFSLSLYCRKPERNISFVSVIIMDHHGNNNRMQVVEEDELWNGTLF